MLDLILTLVFSIVMLLFMAFPAMKIVDWLSHRIDINKKFRTALVITVTIILSLIIGVFLSFAQFK